MQLQVARAGRFSFYSGNAQGTPLFPSECEPGCWAVDYSINDFKTKTLGIVIAVNRGSGYELSTVLVLWSGD